MRQASATALGSIHDPGVVPVLVRLTTDEQPRVRDWATFGLGTCHEGVDTPEVREALLARTDDDDDEVRGEALIGLAHRKDARVIPKIRRELAGEIGGAWVFEAAELTGDASLIPDLEGARWEESEVPPRLTTSRTDAIERLRKGSAAV